VSKAPPKPQSVIVLGSGALQIGQAGEFDYSGSQAIKAFSEEGVRTVLVNPNIATIQTSEGMADRLYLNAVTPRLVRQIAADEGVDGVALSFGGQTALNCGLELEEWFREAGIQVLGTPVKSIRDTEDRGRFNARLAEIGVLTARSIVCHRRAEAREAARTIGLPLMLRIGFALGGKGSAIVDTEAELEAALKPHGVTLRHFPQSFQHSTLGGWIATRSGGHFATLYTHIDDLVENVTMVTPSGRIESRRLPGSGAGPSPDRLLIGSEGSLGIITEAWVRVQGRVRFKATAGFRFPDFVRAAGAVRAIAQAGLFPANVRIVDGVELAVNGAGDGSFTLMVVSFESADRPVDTWMDIAEECALDQGGVPDADWRTNPDAHLMGAAGAWREAFIRMPYNREVLTPLGIISDTFESAITWDRFEAFYHHVRKATHDAIREATGREGAVSCRFSHAYPDGPAPYFAFHCAADPDSMLEQWWEIKRAVSDAVLDNGGTITHHHAIGRDHQPWYERQRPPLFGDVLAHAKTHLDPKGILNPGVLVARDGYRPTTA